MNLPEYRRAIRTAHEQFEKSVAVAAEALAAALREADAQFHEDPDEPRKAMAEPRR